MIDNPIGPVAAIPAPQIFCSIEFAKRACMQNSELDTNYSVSFTPYGVFAHPNKNKAMPPKALCPKKASVKIKRRSKS